MSIRELTTKDDLTRAFPVLRELRADVAEADYLTMLEGMSTQGYRLFALEENDEIVALAGITQGLNFYYGKYVWVYDLITSEKARSRGHGQKLLSHVESLARDMGCRTIALSSGFVREDAHRFYEERMGYERVSYVFRKDLEN